MQRHPLKQSFERKITGVLSSVAVIVLLWFTLIMYLKLSLIVGLVISVSYLVPVYTSLYYYWYINSYFRNFTSKAVAAILATLLSITVSYTVFALFDSFTLNFPFSYMIPLMVLTGTSVWIISVQWYISLNKNNGAENNNGDEETDVEPTEELKQISVKEGSRIHIIKTGDINYIQAYGDYVMLFTHNGKYIKEQTMKYFEANLPGSFIRIHRSCIVNSDNILRAELFGKESYIVHLKDGIKLRASNTGYKLLKERLNF